MNASRLFILLVALMMLPLPAAFGVMTTEYTREDENGSSTTVESVTLDLAAGESDDLTSIIFPNSEVMDAQLGITGTADNDGSYAEDLEVKVRNAVWRYSGQGYGALGSQERFATGSYSTSGNFPEAGSTTVELLLPANATVTDATMDVSGRPYGSGNLDDHRLSSIDTNGGSISSDPRYIRAGQGPELLVDGSDRFLVWLDSGNLNEQSTAWDNILFRRYSSGWDDPILLNGSQSLDYLYSPQLVREGNDLFAGWYVSPFSADDFIEFAYSSNRGASWSDPLRVDIDDLYIVQDIDFAASDGSLYVLWSDYENRSGSGTDYDVWLVSSDNNGGTWSSPVLVTSGSDATSYYPRLVASGSDVHVTWLEYDSANLVYSAYYSRSTNGGTSFIGSEKMSGDSEVDYTVVAADDSNNVIVAWNDDTDGDLVADAVTARVSSTNGATFGTELTLSDGGDYYTYEVDIAADGDGGFEVAWLRYTGEQANPYRITHTHCDSGCSTWTDPEMIDSGEDTDFRNVPALNADSSGVGIAWSDRDSSFGGSSDSDIVFQYDSGSGWSAPELVSEHYYEADSEVPVLASAGDWLYMLYRDGGDLDQDGDSNGNDAHADDGDIFFRRSSNNAESWSDPTVVSQINGDGDSNGGTIGYQYRSAIAAVDSYVYAAWVDWNLMDIDDYYDYEIMFAISSDYGATWDEPFILSDSYGDDYSYEPVIVAQGSHVYVAWREYGNVDGSGALEYDIAFRHSEDYGQNWDDTVVPYDTDGADYYPALALGGDRVYLALIEYRQDPDSTLYDYYVMSLWSDDHGNSWTEPVIVSSEDESNLADYPVLAADSDTLYVAWTDYGNYDGDGVSDYDVIFKSSGDGGSSWSQPIVISDDTATSSSSYLFPTLAAGSGLVYVAWQNYNGSDYSHQLRFSDDQGAAWSDWTEISDPGNEKQNVNYAAPGATVGKRACFAYSSSEDMVGAGEDDNDIFVRCTLGEEYPDNPTIDIDGGSSDWQWSGELNDDNSPVTWSDSSSPGALKSLTDALNAALQDNPTTEVDEYGVEMARLELTLGSDSQGVLRLNALEIEYDVELIFTGEALRSTLQVLVNNAPAGQETVDAKITVSTETAGRVTLSGLALLTADADLEITSLEVVSGELLQGSDVWVSAAVENNGDAPAQVEVSFWYDEEDQPHYIGSATSQVDNDGDPVSIGTNWRDLPVGGHTLIAVIVASTPTDRDDDGNRYTLGVTVAAADPIIEVETFELVGTPVEGQEITLTVTLGNSGNRYGLVDLLVFEDQADGELVMFEPGLHIAIDESVTRSVEWLADASVEKLILVVRDNQTDVDLLDPPQELDLQVQTLVNFVVEEVTWADLDGNPLAVFAEGTEAEATIKLLNSGTFDVHASVELRLEKPGEDPIVPQPAYITNIGFEGGESVIISDLGNLPHFSFDGGSGGLDTGEWDLVVTVSNIIADDSSGQGLWDENLEFEDRTNKVEVVTPPDVSVSSFSFSPSTPKTGDTVTFTVSLFNAGGAPVSGTLRLYQSEMAAGVVLVSRDFNLQGDGMDSFDLEWTVPQNMAGDFAFTVQVAELSPAESLQAFTEDNVDSVTVNIEGTVTTRPSTTDDGPSLLIPLAVMGVLLVVLGGAYFFFQQRRDGADGSGDELPPAAPAAPAATTAPPAAETEMAPPPVAPPPPPPPAAAAGVTIQCPGCSTQLKITDTQRPLTVACPGCQTHLKLEQ